MAIYIKSTGAEMELERYSPGMEDGFDNDGNPYKLSSHGDFLIIPQDGWILNNQLPLTHSEFVLLDLLPKEL